VRGLKPLRGRGRVLIIYLLLTRFNNIAPVSLSSLSPTRRCPYKEIGGYPYPSS